MRRSNDEGSTTRSLDDYILSKSYFRARISPMYGRSPTREGQARATRSRNRSQRAPPRAASPSPTSGAARGIPARVCRILGTAPPARAFALPPRASRRRVFPSASAPPVARARRRPRPGIYRQVHCAELADLGGEHHDTIAVVAHEYLGVDPVHLEGSVRALDRHLERRDARRGVWRLLSYRGAHFRSRDGFCRCRRRRPD